MPVSPLCLQLLVWGIDTRNRNKKHPRPIKNRKISPAARAYTGVRVSLSPSPPWDLGLPARLCNDFPGDVLHGN